MKGDLSIARCIFRHLRNSIAHGNIEAIKIKNNNYLKFIDINPRNENHNFIMILRARNLEHFISALMTTIKESPLAFIDAT
nr:HEPN family nuclease [Aeromonas media]